MREHAKVSPAVMEEWMVGRRSVLGMVARTVAAGTLVLRWARLSALEGRAGAGHAGDDFGEGLQEAVSRLGARVYSEQGIPMILACEDLVAGDPAVPPPGEMNAEFAPVFARCAAAWERLHPEAAAGDVASLVELLAFRDFASGGRSAD